MVSRVGIFWDYENCHPSSSQNGCQIANNIRDIALHFGTVTSFKAYLDVSLEGPRTLTLQSQLHASGVTLVHCPHDSRKDVVDRALTVDMLAFAFDSPSPATVFIITGDRDYAYAISTVRMRGHHVILIMPSATAHANLRGNVDFWIYWKDVVEWPMEETTPIRTQVEYTPIVPPSFIEYTPIIPPSLARTEAICPAFTPGSVDPGEPLHLESSFSDASGSVDTEIAEISRPSTCIQHVSLRTNNLTFALRPLSLRRSRLKLSNITSGDSNTTSESLKTTSGNLNATSASNVSLSDTELSAIPEMFKILVKVMWKGKHLSGSTILFTDLVNLLRTANPNYCKGCGGAKKYIQKAQHSHIVLILGSDKGTKFSVELCQSVISTINGTLAKAATKVAQPGKFMDLVNILKTLQSENDSQPTYSTVGSLLLKSDPDAYSKVGCSRLKKYLELAREQNLVEVGPDWVRLRTESS